MVVFGGGFDDVVEYCEVFGGGFVVLVECWWRFGGDVVVGILLSVAPSLLLS